MNRLSTTCIYSSFFCLTASVATNLLGWRYVAISFVLLAGGAIAVYCCAGIWERFIARNVPAVTVTSTAHPEEWDIYVGTYTSQDLRMKIHVTRGDGGELLAQATGQLAFPLHAIDKNVFDYSVAGLIMEFRPDNNKFVLIQNGGYFPFIKEA